MRAWIAVTMAMVLALFATPASAREAPVRSTCYAAATLSEPLGELAATPGRWQCGLSKPSIAPVRTVLRFALDPEAAQSRYFVTRASRFTTLTLAIVHRGRVVAERQYPAASLVPARSGNRILVPLPRHAGPADAVLAAIDLPTTPGLFTDARLYADDPTQGRETTANLILAAILCGMLLMPLAFNAVYFRVLRENFVLWHMVISVSLLVQCLLTTGIVANFVALPLPEHSRASILSFGTCIAAAAAFCAAFIEPGKLHPALRKGLYIAAAQVLVTTLFHAFFPNVLRGINTPMYYAGYIPVLVLFLLVMVDAARRGSRAVWFQIVGWAPFIATGVIRIVTMLLPELRQNEAMSLFYVAMVIESVATSLGVADRFMTIKRQRDQALARAQSLEHLSERDDLTGLYNRRALDGPLGNFRVQEFTGFALFDLDNFKHVNDTHGHATGDAVLRTVAGVLDGHEDAVALRMGGEEFLLLLRGENVQERVERLREAIPVRIAREVVELEMLVTASAGLVEAAPMGDIGQDFVALYRAADDLLYEAKHNGRNLLAAVTLKRETAAPFAGLAA